jgi:hypothetical protein
MQRFFANLKVPKKPSGSGDKNPQTSTSPPPSSATVHKPALKPEFIVPPMPHPCPHDHLALLATPEGLLIRPHTPGYLPDAHIRVSWGKSVKLEEIDGPGESNGEDWSESVVVYGILGTMELFECTSPSLLQFRAL